MAELAACLTLCAPSGMTSADRKEWLSVAYPRIADIPADLLTDASRHAQDTCDHPAKIVPTIKGFVAERWSMRSEARAAILRDRMALVPPEEPERWVPEPGELEQIKRDVVAKLKADRR